MAGFGERIRKQRQRLGLKQHELAALVGVDRTAVSNWEREIHFPDRYEGKLEEVLGVSLGDDDGTPGLPPLVADYAHVRQVWAIWSIPEDEMPERQRLGLIRLWLRDHPQEPAPARSPRRRA